MGAASPICTAVRAELYTGRVGHSPRLRLVLFTHGLRVTSLQLAGGAASLPRALQGDRRAYQAGRAYWKHSSRVQAGDALCSSHESAI